MGTKRAGGAAIAALVVVVAGAGCHGGRLGTDGSSTIDVPDAGIGGGAAVTDAGPTTSGPIAPPVACPSGPTAAASDTVIPDGSRPVFHRCGTLGEVATGVAVSPDGSRVAVRAGEGVHLFDTASWREVARLVNATDPIDAAAFSPDSHRLATVSSYIGQVAIWNADDGSLLRVTPRDPAMTIDQLAAGAGVAFSSDGRRVATALGTIVDVDTGAIVRLQDGAVRRGRNYAMWFLQGDRTVGALTLYHSGDSWTGLMFERFDAQTGAYLDGVGDHAVLSADRSTVAGRPYRSSQLVVERLHADGSRALSTFPSGAYAPFGDLVAVTAHGEALLATVGTAIEAHAADDPTKVISRIEPPPGTTFLAMSPADEVVATGPSAGTVAWNWRTGAVAWTQPFPVTQIAWGGALTAAIGPGVLWRAWRTATGAALCGAPSRGVITRRIFSPDGAAVALTYDDGSVELRDGDLGNPRPLMFRGAAAGERVISLSRTGARAVVAVGDEYGPRDLVVIDTNNGYATPSLPLGVPFGHTAFVSADGARLAFDSPAGIRLIDLPSGAVLFTEDKGSWLLGFGPDDRQLAVLTAERPQSVVTYAAVDGAPAATLFVFDERASLSALAPDWSFAVTSEQSASGFVYTTLRWPRGGGAPRTLTERVPLGQSSVSADGALFFDGGLYFHEFTGDYMELNVVDAASGAEVQDFVDHAISPSADGRRLFGQAGALFCR